MTDRGQRPDHEADQTFTADDAFPQNTGMTEAPTQDEKRVADDGVIVFEQPLNERLRTFLRLDFLYSQALYHNERASEWGSRAAVSTLIDILAVVSRGDTRADVMKELERQLTLLTEYQARSGVDPGRLKAVLSNLQRLRTDLIACGTGYLQPLKESEFLAAVKHRSNIPGGTCEFDLPDYSFWLHESAETRAKTFNEWLTLLRPLCDAIAEILWLTRQAGRPRQEVAKGGVFNITFDKDNPTQLMRISVPQSLGLYPETSGSHYRCSVRFLHWNGLTKRATQVTEDVPFTVTLCN